MPHRIMKSTKLSLCLNALLFHITVAYSCDPAEEGRPYLLKHSLAKVPWGVTMVTWTKDDILVADCPVATASCTTNAMTWLVAGVIKTDDNTTFFLNISSVSRLSRNNSKGIWKLKTHTSSPSVEEFYDCNLQVYAKIKETKCTKTLSKDGLTVSCYGKQVYPEAMMSVIRAPYDTKTLSCQNTRSATELLYYDTECVRTFSVQELHLKREDFIFCIYPNIIGFQNYDQVATNIYMSVLTEPSSISVQECIRTASSINCRCDRLDNDDSKPGFSWYSGDVEVQRKSQIYTATKTTDAVNSTLEDIWCKPITTKTDGNHDVKDIVIYVLIIFVVCTIIVILILCIKYKKCCQPVGDYKQPKVNITKQKCVRRKKCLDVESTNIDKSETPLKNDIEANDSETESLKETTNPTVDFVNEANSLDGEINGAPTLATINLDETNNEHSLQTDHTISTETKFNPKTFQVKSSILLIGTKSRNIERFKNSLLGKTIPTTLTSRKWSVFKKKTKSVHESSENISHTPEMQDNYEKKRGKASKERNGNKGSSNIHLCYSNRNDRVFKLVDGPVYDDREVDKFKDEMKSCLVLCREGYNAVVVVYTSDKEKEATSLIDILRENFAFNMNNIILIKTKYVHCREHKPLSNSTSNVAQMQDDCIEAESTVDFRGTKADLKFKDLFTNRYIGLQLPATEDNINHIFSLIDEMGKANSVSLFIKYDRTLTSNTILETVLRELSLLMETITKRKNKHQRETEQRFKLLQETWEKFVNYNVDNVCESDNNVLIEEDELEDMEDEREETGREFNKEALRQKQEVCEDVTYLIKCLHNVYFAAQQIERNEKILLPYVMKILQNFHDWYVESIISNKDTVLDSNYKMRLFQKIEKRRHKTI